MGKGTNPLLIAVLVFAGYQLLKTSESTGEAGATTTIFGGGGGTGDLSGLFQGIGDMLSGALGGISDMVSKATEGGGTGEGGGGQLDASGLLSSLGNFFENFTGLVNLPGGNGGGGGTSEGGGVGEGGGGGSQSMPNTIPNILNALSGSVDSLSKGLLIGAGTYLGVKAVTPVLPAISGVMKSGVTAVGQPLFNLAGTTTRSATMGIQTIGTWLKSPVTKVPVLGTAGLGVAAFGAGYGLGSLWNITPPGKWMIEKSGELGKKVASTPGFWQNLFFPYAQLPETVAPRTHFRIQEYWGLPGGWEQLKSMTVEQQRALIKSRQSIQTVSTSQPSTGKVKTQIKPKVSSQQLITGATNLGLNIAGVPFIRFGQ